jgi:arylsulfatase A-like enzyme
MGTATETLCWGKHTPFERALKSTLIVRAPGVSVAGTKCDALVETLDLFPTLVDLCAPQFKQTAYPLDGHSLRRLLMGKTTPLRDAALSYWRSAVSVRTPTHRLIATIGKHGLRNTQLHDLRQSPDPAKNLATDQTATAERMLRLIPDTAGPLRR